MNFKKISFFLIPISFVLIVSGSVSSFVLGLKKDRQEISHRIVQVQDEFEIFSTNTSVFESLRDELYVDVLGNTYYDSMYEYDSFMKNKLSNYEHLVDELTKNTMALQDLCGSIYFPDNSVNSKCKNYKSIYEQVVNYFVSDIIAYNRIVDNYNTYQTNSGSLLRIRSYETDKIFIDYNGDSKMDGKEE